MGGAAAQQLDSNSSIHSWQGAPIFPISGEREGVRDLLSEMKVRGANSR